MHSLWQSAPARCEILWEMRQKTYLICFFVSFAGTKKSRSGFAIFFVLVLYCDARYLVATCQYDIIISEKTPSLMIPTSTIRSE
jgi:hypothetical protein